MGKNGVEEAGKGAGFFACYLLTSLYPRFKSHTYIGYTLNPRRRVRQHKDEIEWRTKMKQSWEMVLCIYGFPTKIAVLQVLDIVLRCLPLGMLKEWQPPQWVMD